jgi:hypothetical protein
MSLSNKLINLKEAQEFLESIDDPVIRIALDSARWQVVQRMMARESKDDADFPQEPFDMYFYFLAAHDLFKHKEFLKELLDGNLDAGAWF